MAVSIDALREVKILRGLKDSDLRGSPPTSPSAAWRRATPSSARAPAASPSSSSSKGRRASRWVGRRSRRSPAASTSASWPCSIPTGRAPPRSQAKTDVVLAAMSAWQFRPFVLAQPEVAWTLLQRLARRLREAQNPAEAGRLASWIPSPRSCWAASRSCSWRCSCWGASIRARAPSSSTGARRARPSSRSRTRSTTSTRCARRSTAAGAPAGEAELTEDDLRARVAEDLAETQRAARARASREGAHGRRWLPRAAARPHAGGRGPRRARRDAHAGATARRSRTAGCECWIGDPDRIGSLRYALDNVTVLLWLLGTATGPNVEALHGSRLRMMLDKVTDTTVRAVLYEAAGTVDPAVLEAGAAELALAQTLNEIPGALLRGRSGATPTPGWRRPRGHRTSSRALTVARRDSALSAKYPKTDGFH